MAAPIVLIPARLASSRLPGKALLDMAGMPAGHCRRARQLVAAPGPLALGIMAGGGLAGAFGGMGGGAAFSGSSAVTILTRITQGAGVVAFVVLLALNYMSLSSNRAALSESELKGARKGLSTVLPGTPAPAAAPAGNEAAPAQVPGLGGGAQPQENGK